MREKDYVKQVFSKNKDAYINSSTHANGNDLVNMIEWLKLAPDMIALDIATGGGHVAKQLAAHVNEVIATDLTEEMLRNTAKHLQSCENITFTVADAEDLPFANDMFDIVTCRIAAHHFPDPDKFVAEVARVLRPDGQFLFIDNIAPENTSLDQFNNTLEKMRDYSHVRSRTIAEWTTIFNRQCLQIVKEKRRKKRLPFREWVARTLDSDTEMDRVEKYLLNAAEEIQEYFQVERKEAHVQSFAIDEWMVLFRQNKGASSRSATYGLRPAKQGGSVLLRKAAVLTEHSYRRR
ncbi:methyltransferase domain-containing protein [Virgibacillus dakarensis]|nr:methyltransferase domain-containing protein [Virgibacillus dakarensis]